MLTPGKLTSARRDMGAAVAGNLAIFAGGCSQRASSSLPAEYDCGVASSVVEAVDATGTVVHTAGDQYPAALISVDLGFDPLLNVTSPSPPSWWLHLRVLPSQVRQRCALTLVAGFPVSPRSRSSDRTDVTRDCFCTGCSPGCTAGMAGGLLPGQRDGSVRRRRGQVFLTWA